jgi:hypothetical protein
MLLSSKGRRSPVTTSTTNSSSMAVSERERQKAEEKDRRTKESQQQNAEWYRQQVDQFGKEFYKDYVKDDDPRFPSTMPRRNPSKPGAAPASAAPSRCSMCFLPGHNQQSQLCPLYEAGLSTNDSFKLSGGTKLKFNHSAAAAAVSSGEDGKKRQHQTGTGKKKEKQQTPNGPMLGSLAPGPLAELSKKFIAVLDMLLEIPASDAFARRPRDLPNYFKVVTNPMDLGKMKEKATKGRYKSRKEFWGDLQLMLSNCELFNGAQSLWSSNLRDLIRIAQEDLEQHQAEYQQLENMVSQAKSGSRGGKFSRFNS